jgi:hypothetical protein
MLIFRGILDGGGIKKVRDGAIIVFEYESESEDCVF